MKSKELSIALREMARVQRTPLCDEWYGEWNDDTPVDVLLDKFVRGQDFCIENDYPPLEFVRKHFHVSDLHRHHIYIDEEVDIRDAESGTWIFLGNCMGKISFSGYSVGTVYVRHGSQVNVSATGSSRVFVSMYEDGYAECSKSGFARFRRYDRRDKKKEGV